MANVRFIDSLKVGAYSVEREGFDIDNNVDNYILTATGDINRVNGEAQLQFDGLNLGVGGASTGARFEINSDNSSDLVLIRNSSTGQGIKVDNDGIFQLIEFPTLPTAVEGGIAYSSSGLFVGVE